ncbi:carbonic anhydrase [Rhodopseudomonas palustris BisB5]|uniref:carbonic anhydrase n=1 Tax=Rhodopseudomonas palustris (strain BisB5) TaxID=316057 RepID=Q13D11_RHOPS|nr:carbonic anhydrase [Rhodopseudomonas palustris BisB5]
MCDDCSKGELSRRTLVQAGFGLFAAAALPSAVHAQAASPGDTPDAALDKLMQGNARYVGNQLRERDFSAGRVARSQGQSPFAAILGCADSRIAPELAFDQGPGNLFVVRVAGNFVTQDGLASLEYGAAVLGTKVIMVLGHSNCGAVNATIGALQKGNDLPGHIGDLVRAMKPGIEPALKQAGDNLPQRAVIANVRSNVQQLLESKPILSGLVSSGKLKVVGGVYDLASGKIDLV